MLKNSTLHTCRSPAIGYTCQLWNRLGEQFSTYLDICTDQDSLLYMAIQFPLFSVVCLHFGLLSVLRPTSVYCMSHIGNKIGNLQIKSYHFLKFSLVIWKQKKNSPNDSVFNFWLKIEKQSNKWLLILVSTELTNWYDVHRALQSSNHKRKMTKGLAKNEKLTVFWAVFTFHSWLFLFLITIKLGIVWWYPVH